MRHESKWNTFEREYQKIHIKLKGGADTTDMPKLFEKKIKKLFNKALPLKLERNRATSKIYDNGAKMYNKAIDNVKGMVYAILFDEEVK